MKTWSMALVVLLLGMMTSGAAAQGTRAAPVIKGSGSIDDRIQEHLRNGRAVWLHHFWFDDQRDTYQCAGATGIHVAALGDWSRPIRINTDSGWGGCRLRFAIVDPLETSNPQSLTRVRFTIEFGPEPGVNRAACEGPQGAVEIPVTRTSPTYTQAIRINTDSGANNRPCYLTLGVEERIPTAPPVEMRVRFYADGTGANQCGNASGPARWHVVTPGNPVTLGMNTGSEDGGCMLSIQVIRGVRQ